MTLKYLIQKEFIQIRRNSFLPKLIVVFPIMIMCVMPWVMQMEVKNIVVDVVDIDHTVESQRLIQQIAASNYFIFNGQKANYDEALKDIEKGRADVILEIRDGKYLIAANAVNGTKGSMGSAYLSQIVNRAANTRASSLTLYNKGQNYKLFMIPALFAIVVMLMTGFLPTLNIVGEKEAGTIEQMNVTPVSKWIETDTLLVDSPLRHHRLSAIGLARLWHYSFWFRLAHLCSGHVAGTVLLIVRTHHLQLFRYHATGHLRDVVLRGDDPLAFRTFHAYPIYAYFSLSDHLYQPHALFHRCHAHRLYPRRYVCQCRTSGFSSAWHRPLYGGLGCTEL